MPGAEYLEETIKKSEKSSKSSKKSSTAKTTQLLYAPLPPSIVSSQASGPQELLPPPVTEEIPDSSFDVPDEEWLVDRLQELELEAHANFNYVQNGKSNHSLRRAFEKAIVIYHEIIATLLQGYGNNFDDWEDAIEDEAIRPSLAKGAFSIAEIVERIDLILFTRALEVADFLHKVLGHEELTLFTALPTIKKDMQVIGDLLHARTGDSTVMQREVIMLIPRLSRQGFDHPLGAEPGSEPVTVITPTPGPAAITYRSILAENNEAAPSVSPVKMLLKRIFPHHRVNPLKSTYYKSPGGKALCYRSIHAEELRRQQFVVRIKTHFNEAMPHVCGLMRTLWGSVFYRSFLKAETSHYPVTAAVNRLRRLSLIPD